MATTWLYEVRDATDDGVGIQPDNPWDYASDVRARDPEEAAKKFAEVRDYEGDYYLSKSEDNDIVVEVRLAVRLTSSDAEAHRFRCSASHHTTYSAALINPATPEATP